MADSESRPAPEPPPRSTGELLPVLYDELRRLARWHMAREQPGHALTPTALVHEAFLRIAADRGQGWTSRAQFYGAAAEAMRRILIEDARARGRVRSGGTRKRITLTGVDLAAPEALDHVVPLPDAPHRLA